MPKTTGAKRPVHLAKFSSRKKKAKPRRNPEGGFISNVKDSFMSNGLVHGVGGYASARLVGRIVRRLLASKYPALAKHASPIGNLIVAIVIYFTVKKWRKVREEALVGAVIAFVQSALQTYMPGLAATFLDSDAGLELATSQAAAQTAQGLGAAGGGRGAMPAPPQRRFVLPGEVAVARAEAGQEMGASRGPVQYVMPGAPGSGYGAPADFDDATADIPTGAADDLGDDGNLGIFNP